MHTVERSVFTVDDEDYYRAYLAIEELTNGQFLVEIPEYNNRYDLARVFFKEVISRLKKQDKIHLQVTGPKEILADSDEIIQFKIDLNSFKIILEKVNNQIESPDKKVIGDKSLFDLFEVMRDMFINSTRAELISA